MSIPLHWKYILHPAPVVGSEDLLIRPGDLQLRLEEILPCVTKWEVTVARRGGGRKNSCGVCCDDDASPWQPFLCPAWIMGVWSSWMPFVWDGALIASVSYLVIKVSVHRSGSAEAAMSPARSQKRKKAHRAMTYTSVHRILQTPAKDHLTAFDFIPVTHFITCFQWETHRWIEMGCSFKM